VFLLLYLLTLQPHLNQNYFLCNQDAVFNLWVSVGIGKVEFMTQVSVHSAVLCVVFVTGFQSP